MDGSARLQAEARALVARLREELLRPGDLPTRYRRWLVIGRAEARRHRRETGERFEQSPARQILAASAAVARREGLCAADADEATALLAFLRSFQPGLVPVVSQQLARPPVAASQPEVETTTDAPSWQVQVDGPPL
ncbi:MAG: hypothetical protein U0232_21295 [Thermomicrobiales bacterium]